MKMRADEGKSALYKAEPGPVHTGADEFKGPAYFNRNKATPPRQKALDVGVGADAGTVSHDAGHDSHWSSYSERRKENP